MDEDPYIPSSKLPIQNRIQEYKRLNATYEKEHAGRKKNFCELKFKLSSLLHDLDFSPSSFEDEAISNSAEEYTLSRKNLKLLKDRIDQLREEVGLIFTVQFIYINNNSFSFS